MNKDKELASDSDESDEDFCPDESGISDAPSEEESNDDVTDKEPLDNGKNKNRIQNQNRSKRKKLDVEKDENYSNPENVTNNMRRTRHNNDVIENGKETSFLEKEELESDEKEKSRTDALWADFLKDVKPNVKSDSKTKPKIENKKHLSNPCNHEKDKIEPKNSQTIPTKVVTEIFDFAGEEVKIEKVITSDSIKENKKLPKASGSGLGLKNISLKKSGATGSRGAIGNILNQLEKKKKISVLEKTKLDWNNFKVTEGIQEELQTFNKGKDGYLERQDFLQRTDLRQFEIEKNLRETKRSKR